MAKSEKKIFTEEGLRFECVKGCVKCCAIPGSVFVHEKEIPAMAEYFKMTEEDFIEKYLKTPWGGIWKLNFPEDEPCMFLEENGCSIYPVRPAQCRTFPFWPENISNVKEWQKLRKLCPGIGKGRLYTIDEITDIMAEVSFGPFLCF